MTFVVALPWLAQGEAGQLDAPGDIRMACLLFEKTAQTLAESSDVNPAQIEAVTAAAMWVVWFLDKSGAAESAGERRAGLGYVSRALVAWDGVWARSGQRLQLSVTSQQSPHIEEQNKLSEMMEQVELLRENSQKEASVVLN